MGAGVVEIFSELLRGDLAGVEGFGTDGPDGGNPGEFGAGAPLVGEVKPLAWPDGGFDLFARFEGKEGGVADEDGGVCVLQHGDGIGCGGEERGVGVEEFAEEDLGVGERTARGCVGSDGFYCAEGVGRFNDELDGADFAERRDGAAGDDGEVRRKGGDGDEAKVGAGGEDLVGAQRGLGVVEGVALGESGGQGRVFEVPHEGSGVEEVDGGDTKPVGW